MFPSSFVFGKRCSDFRRGAEISQIGEANRRFKVYISKLEAVLFCCFGGFVVFISYLYAPRANGHLLSLVSFVWLATVIGISVLCSLWLRYIYLCQGMQWDSLNKFLLCAKFFVPVSVVLLLFFVASSAGLKLSLADGNSMLPNLSHGDRILAVSANNVNREDVVSIDVGDGSSIAKRIVGEEGDVIYLNIPERDMVTASPANKREYPVCLSSAPSRLYSIPQKFPCKVPAGHYFVAGDNHESSWDSRHFGVIPAWRVTDRLVFRVWPPHKIGRV